MRIDPFCSDLMLEAEGLCHFWLGNLEDALASFRKLKIDTRDSLFYTALTYKKIGDSDKAVEYLRRAHNTTKLTNEKFLESQKYKLDETKKELESLLNSIS